MDRYNDALSAYQAALSQSSDKDNKKRSQIHYRMGECLIRLNRIREAVNALEKAAASDDNNVGAQLRIGEFLLSAGAADRAREQAEAIVRRNPRNGEAIALWGAAMEGLGQKEKAKQAYRDALSIEPGSRWRLLLRTSTHGTTKASRRKMRWRNLLRQIPRTRLRCWPASFHLPRTTSAHARRPCMNQKAVVTTKCVLGLLR